MKAVAVAALALVCVFGIASAQLFGATGFGAAGFGAPATTTGGFGQGGRKFRSMPNLFFSSFFSMTSNIKGGPSDLGTKNLQK